MRFYTTGSKPLACSEATVMRQSCERFGINLELEVLADFSWAGWASRKAFVRYIRALPGAEVVLTTDAWDAFFCAGPGEIEGKYRESGFPIVMAAETVLYPPEFWGREQYPPSPTRWRYANGGVVIGTVEALLSLFTADDFWPAGMGTNQEAFHDWVLRHPGHIGLDRQAKLFQTLYGVPGGVVAVRDGRIVNRETGSFPCIVHGNGGNGWRAAELWRQMNAPKEDRAARLRAERRKLLARRR